MACKTILLFISLVTPCIIDILGMEINSGFLNIENEDIPNVLTAKESTRRYVNGLEMPTEESFVEFHPDYVIMEKLLPFLNKNMGLFRGKFSFPSTTSQEVTSPFDGNELLGSSRFGDDYNFFTNMNSEDQGRDIGPEMSVTEEPRDEGNATPPWYLTRSSDTPLNWGNSEDDRVGLNGNSEKYNEIENIHSKFNEKIIDVNQYKMKKEDFTNDIATHCNCHCHHDCCGANSRAFASNCESFLQPKSLIININRDCSDHPRCRYGQRFIFIPNQQMP